MKIQITAAAAALACAALLGINGCGSSGTTSHPVPVDIYVAGTDGNNAVYWKNGAETVVAQNASAQAIAVSGSDVYVGGVSSGANGPVATVWKNGAATILSNDQSSVKGIAVANGNVYVVGNVETATTILATLWTNGTPTQLSDGMIPSTNYLYFTYAYSITTSGSDTYVAGTAQKFFQISSNNYYSANVAVYWKNGVPVDLSQVTNQGPNIQATSIAISGSSIYVAGNVFSPSGYQAVYWNTGTRVPLIPGTFAGASALTSSIASSGTNVYIAGGPSGYVQGYWVNGTFKPFTSPSTFGGEQTTQIAVNGTDVYVAGSIQANVSGNYGAAYWKNGAATTLTASSPSSAAYGIVLVPQQ